MPESKRNNLDHIDWQIREFAALTTTELYDILQLRLAVFAVEQKCFYQDLDGLDQRSAHIMAFVSGQLSAYARIIPPGVKFMEASIGRIVTTAEKRNLGLGKILVEKSIAICRQAYPSSAIRISAQCYLDGFYKSFGFRPVSDIYQEDGIDHREMVLEI